MPLHPDGETSAANTPRQRFVQSIDVRIEALLSALGDLEQATAHDPLLKRQLERRLGAMADASAALGLDQLSAAFTSAEASLASANDPASTARAARAVRGTLQLVPALVPAPTRPSTATGAPPPSTATGAPPPSTPPVPAPHQALHAAEPARTQATPDLASTDTLRVTSHDVIVLGTLPLNRVARRTGERLPHLNVLFTVDQADAEALAATCARPAFVLDARRPDVGREFHTLSELGPCIVVEATRKQQASFERHGAHVALVPGDELTPALAELFETADQRTLPAPPPAPTEPPHSSASTGTPSPEPSLAGQSPETLHPAPLPSGLGRKPATRNSSADVANLPTRTVLVADADPAMSWFMTGVLRSARVNVLEARDGSEALSLAEERHPDLVISDVALPGLDGYGLCRNLKRDVVLADTPVLLVSWKEEQLQRVRELGAGADGYFLKEVDSATILRRCAEVLHSRTHVEQRLRSEGSVRGRLEGMTPWTVLRLTCEVVGNARITFSDAGYHYGVTVGDGRLLGAQRDTATGDVETGASVLPGLLGMRAGKFVVEPHGACVQPSFFGSLQATLSPHISRIRRALRVLQGDTLHRVARLELDAAVFRPYAESSPVIVRRAIEKLMDGVPPFALTRSISAGLLESVLVDLALRGAFTQALDMNGIDLLDGSDAFRQPFDLELRTPTAGFELVTAKGAPRVTRDSTESDVAQAVQYAASAAPAELDSDVDSASAPALAPPPADDSLAAPAATGPTLTPSASVAGCAVAVAPPTESPAPPALAVARQPGPVMGESSPSAAAQLVRRQPTAAPRFEIAFLDGPPAAASSPAPATTGPDRRDGDEIEAAASCADLPVRDLDLSDALFGSLAGTPSPTTADQPTPRDQATPAPSEPASDSKLLVASRLREASEESLDDDDPLFAALHAESSPPPRPTPARDETTTPRKAAVPTEAVKHRAAQLGVLAKQMSSRALAWAKQRTTGDAAQAGPGVAGSTSPEPPSAASIRSDQPAAPEPSPTPVTPPAGAAAADDAAAPSPAPPGEAGRFARLVHATRRTVLPVAAVLGAAALAFAGMGALVERIAADREAVLSAAPKEIAEAAQALKELSEPEAGDDLGPPGAHTADVTPPTRTVTAHVEMRTSELPLPEGVSVSPGRGLLEVNTADAHRIYVDGLFVGRGPVRRVPLEAGSHRVELRVDGEVDALDVVVAAGKRVRLEPASQAALQR